MKFDLMREYSLRKKAIDKTQYEELSIVEWHSDDSNLYGYGVTDDGDFKYFMHPTKFGLIVGLRDKKHVVIFNNNPLIDFVTFIESDLKANDLTVFHQIYDNDKPLYMYKLQTSTFIASKQLYNELNQSCTLHFVVLPVVWNLEIFMMFENVLIKYNTFEAKHFTNCILYYDKFSITRENKLVQKTNTLNFIPTICFDVETVSPLKDRVPTGELFSDVCFSVSFLIELEPGKRKVITLINLPMVTEKFDIDTKYPDYDRETIVFQDEKSMLSKAFEILSYKKYYVAIGYNSAYFDMPYLMNRAYLLNMEEFKNFTYQNGIFVYGIYMTHIDLFIYSNKYFELPNYKLNTVAKYCLEKNKVDINAVNLRYVYEYFCKENDIDHLFVFPDEKFTLKDAIKYNEMDTILVYEIFTKTKMTESLQDLSKSYMLNWNRGIMSRSNENYCNKMFRNSCAFGRLFAINHSMKSVILPGRGLLRLNNMALISKDLKKETNFCGGMNYVGGRTRDYNILAFDYTAFYPYLIGDNNLSHETINIVRVKEIRDIWPDLQKAGCEIRLFVDTRGDSDMETQLKCRALVNGFLNHGRVVTDPSKIDDDSRVVILNRNVDGVLSLFIKRQNQIRDKSKSMKKELESLIEEVESELVQKIIDEDKEMEVDEFDFDDEFEDDEEEVVDDEPTDIDLAILTSKIEKKKIKKLNTSELESYKLELNGELSRIMAYYRTLKKENSSYFGLLGSMTSIRGPHVACALTARARFFIVETAREAQRLGAKVIFIDTDSVFTNQPSHCDLRQILPQKMKMKNQALTLNVKVYNTIDVFAKKTYIFEKDDGIFSRGINKNGPKIWEDIFNDAFTKYVKKDVKLYLDTVQKEFEDIYEKLYLRVKENPSIAICSTSVKNLHEYKTNTAVKKMLDRELALNPLLQIGKSMTFVHVFNILPSKTYYVSTNRLNTIEFYNINLYKFLSKIMTYIKKMVAHTITLTMINEKKMLIDVNTLVDKLDLAAYVAVRNRMMEKYKDSKINTDGIDISNVVDLDMENIAEVDDEV